EVLQLTRQSLGEQVAETRGWSGDTPLVLTVHLRILSAVVLPTMQCRQPTVVKWQPAAELAAGSTRIVERIPPDPQTVDVADAEVIISAGLGCNEQTFVQVRELTRLLNVSLGVTRPVYDLGFAGFERMVGQTGKTVAPRLYLALGISGSMHHIGGIKDSKRIVSVNIDPKVPIFPNSDEGFVADLREVMPLLLERVRSIAGGEA
ncbi:MAG: electron transfer flavoprotein subunit alpha/FixB family protein, partial [Desulfuromonadales bacterium]